MQVLVKVLEQEFTDDTNSTKAFIKACKWYANKFLNNEKYSNLKVEYKCNNDEKKVKAILYTSVDTNDVQNRHCDVCKELHSKVYENEKYNCDSCNMLAYNNKIKEVARIKRTYYRDIYFEKLRNV